MNLLCNMKTETSKIASQKIDHYSTKASLHISSTSIKHVRKLIDKFNADKKNASQK